MYLWEFRQNKREERWAYRFSSERYVSNVLNKRSQNTINKICEAAEDFIERVHFELGALDRYRNEEEDEDRIRMLAQEREIERERGIVRKIIGTLSVEV